MDDPYDLTKGGDPYDLTKGGDPYDLGQLAQERDQEIVAGVTRPQQTIVGAISGGGDRHVVQTQRRADPVNLPNPIFSRSGSITVTDGTTTVENVTTISFDGDLFEITDDGDGGVTVTLQTTDCST